MNLNFNKFYFMFFVILLIAEVLIALLIEGGFIRHTFGDFLVVILMYCFLKSFWDINPIKVALVVLTISILVELLQYFNLLKILHLENNIFAKLILGSTFHVTDIIAYCFGIIIILLIELKFNKQHK